MKHKNNKKGVTLIELICGLAIVALAIVFVVQLMYVGAIGYSRSAILDKNVQGIAAYFETGSEAQMQADKSSGATAVVAKKNVEVTITFGPIPFKVPSVVETATVTDKDGKTKAQLSCLSASIGKGE